MAMSGGVDSSVAAALLREAGHDVTGATMKLWGGESDTGCCSVSDVDDARRVCQQLQVPHHVFNFSDDFEQHVVGPYVAEHAGGRTPNPCVECNRHLKFDRFLQRALKLGFDAIATGHYARVVRRRSGAWELRRGADEAKDQSYVLHMLGQRQLARTLLPIGEMTKPEVRDVAARLGLRTAAKADSQDVCFITRAQGREAFLSARIPVRDATVVDGSGAVVGSLPGFELLTVGQRRGLGSHEVGGRRAYIVDRDVATATVRIGTLDDLCVDEIVISEPSWVAGPPEAGERALVQMSAHGKPVPCIWLGEGRLRVEDPVRRVAPGQSVVLYRDDAVVGGGPAT